MPPAHRARPRGGGAFWAGAGLSHRRGTPWAASPHCLPVAGAAEQATLACAPRDRALLHAELCLGCCGRSQPGWGGAGGLLQRPQGTKCLGLRAREAGEEEEPGQREDFGHNRQVLRVELSG